MFLLNAAVMAEAETKIALFLPAWMFPLIAALVFVALGFILYSFRDVANRHSHQFDKTTSTGHTTDH
jgi:heme/copper-type cytochrome/quinol oxidase subunit 2